MNCKRLTTFLVFWVPLTVMSCFSGAQLEASCCNPLQQEEVEECQDACFCCDRVEVPVLQAAMITLKGPVEVLAPSIRSHSFSKINKIFRPPK